MQNCFWNPVQLFFPSHISIWVHCLFTNANLFPFLLLKVIDEQTVQSCESISQPCDDDNPETDESKDDDTKDSSAGKEIVMVSQSVTTNFALSFSVWDELLNFYSSKGLGKFMLLMSIKIIMLTD